MKNRKNSGLDWCTLVLCAVAAGVGLNALESYLQLDRLSQAYEQIRTMQYSVTLMQGILQYAVLAPIVEELLFRGVAYNLMQKWFPWQLAMVLSAFLFAVYHGNVIQGSYAFCMGMLLAYMYHYFGRFLAPVLFHGAANLSVFLLSYHPQTIPQGMLLPTAVVGIVVAAGLIYRFRRCEANKD